MLRTTFGQLASISGRAILAIGLTSATVLALAPSAKAQVLTANNPVYRNINSYTPALTTPDAGAAGIAAVVGILNVSSNDVFVIKATGSGSLTGSNGGTAAYTLKIGTGSGSAATAAVTATPTTFYSGSVSEANTNKDLDVTVSSSVNFRTLRAGTFTDSITLTIAGS